MDSSLQSEIENRVSTLIEQDDFSQSEGFAVMEGDSSLSLLPSGSYVHEFDLDALRMFPFYLCKSQLFTGHNIGDNRHYWGWTLLCAKSMSATELEIEDLSTEAVSDIVSFLRMIYLRDVKSILREIDRKKWASTKEPQIPIEHTLTTMIPDPHELDKQLSRAAFSTLESVLKRKCKEVDLEGYPVQDAEYEKYINHYTSVSTRRGNRAGYEDLLDLWKDKNSNPTTSKFLTKIQDIDESHNREDSIINTLSERFGSDDSSDNNLFWLLRQLRNHNIHGEIEGHTGNNKFKFVVTNLLCLIFWDSISDSSFRENIEEIRDRNQKFSNSDHSVREEDIYYPAFGENPDFWD
jgi:hypothetical protein